MTRLRPLLAVLAGLILLAASGCSTLDRSSAPPLDRQASWVVLPFANHTETPLAGSRAEAIAEALLRSEGVNRVRATPASLRQDSLFEPGDAKQREAALTWAREQGARYALAGQVDEWRYKVGVDGEPAAGVALSFIDVASGDTLWSGVGGKTGWSREALSAVGQSLMRELLRGGLAGQKE